MDEDAFFDGRADAYAIHRAVEQAVRAIGPAEVRVSKSQVGFHRRHPFAATWTPGRHLRGAVAPLVLSVFLKRRDASVPWKKVVEPAPGRFTHHLELHSAAAVDERVKAALAEAWRDAG
jgi:hypothetical protein